MYSHTRSYALTSHTLVLSCSHTPILRYSQAPILSYSHTLILSYSHTLILSYMRRFSLLPELQLSPTRLLSVSWPHELVVERIANGGLRRVCLLGLDNSATTSAYARRKAAGNMETVSAPAPAARLLPFSKPTRRPRRAVARHSLAHLGQRHVPHLERNMLHRPEGHPGRPAECAECSMNANFSCEQHRWQSEHVISGPQRSSVAISVPMARSI